MVTVKEVVNIHEKICNDARSLIPRKGKKYCGVQQQEGDTLHSRRLQKYMGITDMECLYSLGRASEKLMRMVSMMKQNIDDKEENILESVKDLINDIIFAYILYEEEKVNKPEISTTIKIPSSTEIGKLLDVAFDDRDRTMSDV